MNWNIYVTEEDEEDLISAVDYIDSVVNCYEMTFVKKKM